MSENGNPPEFGAGEAQDELPGVKGKVVAKGRIKDPLPPPGHNRRELLKRRTEDLEQQAEGLPEGYAIDERSMRADYNLRRQLISMERVSKEQPGWEYAWVDPTNNMLFTMAQNNGWEVVKGEMPEAWEHRDVNGYRRIGDVILVRIRADRREQLRMLDEMATERQKEAVTERLEELGQRFQRAGGKIHTNISTMDPRMAQTIMNRAGARELAFRDLGDKLKAGTIPGAEMPKRR